MKKEILIIGKSGVGKSSFINYLFDKEEVCETGTGKPVTSKGIFKKEYIKDYNLYDSWGLEANKSSEWKDMLEKCLDNIKSPNIDLPIKGYFDTIFYCLSAKSARLECVERDILITLWEKKYFPIIVLTKSDIASEDEKKALKDELRKINSDLNFVEVGSIDEETFSGKIESFGKTNIEKLIYLNYINKLVNFVPNYLVKNIKVELKNKKTNILKDIDAKKYNIDTLNEELRVFVNESISKKLNEELVKILELYDLKTLNISSINNSSSSSLGRATIYGIIMIADFFTTPFLPLTLISALVDYFTIKRRLKKHVEKSFSKLEKELDGLENTIKNNILEKASAIMICSNENCNSKLKVSLTKKSRCPKCGNIEDIKNYY